MRDQMRDQYGRVIDYIRISVTDRCNLRCVYCMPEEGVPSVPHNRILRFDEIARICRILAEDGLHKVKITGGEPLVRRGTASLVRQLKEIPGIDSVTITTNGVLLEQFYGELADAGIDEITVSLDTLDREVYEKITRRDELGQVKRGLKKAFLEGRVPLKINCVPVLGAKEQDILSVAELARDHSIHVRFIEMMPIGFGRNFPFVKEEQIRNLLSRRYGALTPYEGVLGNGPSQYCSIDGFQGKIGFISAVSHKFCSSCNRIRLTPEGFFKTCLQYDYGVELKPMLEQGSTDEELRAAMLTAVKKKPSGHNFLEEQGFSGREHRGMSQIGG